MIRILENNFDLKNYNRLKEHLFLEISKNITVEDIDTLKLILKNSDSKCVYCIVRDIIFYDDANEYLANEYNVNLYIELAYYYAEALKAKANLNLRKLYLTNFKNYIDSNVEAQTFIPDYALLDDLVSLHSLISNKSLYVSFINEKLFNVYLDFNEVCSNIFDYDKYIDSVRNQIVETTKIKICPYCNQEPIYEITSQSGELRMIGDLDHFYLQSKMPLLGLTFNNFIPSCLICNRALKHQSLARILNPRKRGFDSDAKFLLKNIIALKTNDVEGIEVNLEINGSGVVSAEIKASKELFEIDQLYNHISNKEEIKRLYNSTAILSEGGAKIWKKMFGVETFEEAYERLLGFNIDTTDFINIRHGKLLSDIFGEEYFR